MGDGSLLLRGRKLNSSLIPSRASISFSNAPWATPGGKKYTGQIGEVLVETSNLFEKAQGILQVVDRFTN